MYPDYWEPDTDRNQHLVIIYFYATFFIKQDAIAL